MSNDITTIEQALNIIESTTAAMAAYPGLASVVSSQRRAVEFLRSEAAGGHVSAKTRSARR